MIETPSLWIVDHMRKPSPLHEKPGNPNFDARRAKAKEKLGKLGGASGGSERQDWFLKVYEEAGSDPAMVPWADLAPKSELLNWLSENPGEGRAALDVACGLGDNAEAVAQAGYITTAFDLSPEAVRWAIQRFPQSAVDYLVHNLFDLPREWEGAFDLVHECFTIQALQGDLRDKAIRTISSLVAPGGTLVLIAWRGAPPDHVGPPWPVTDAELECFEYCGLETLDTVDFEATRAGGVTVQHQLVVFGRAKN